jgi:hypothetical protein
MKKTTLIVLGALAGLFVLVTIMLIATKLDTTVSTVKFMFISSDPSKEQQVEYSYSYQGNDLIRGGKFGGHYYSDSKTATTGQIIEIPTKRIISYWPFSQFTYLLINSDQIGTSEKFCSWTASIWADKYESMKNGDIKSKEAFIGYIYLTNPNNEFSFGDVKDKVIEIKCL